MPVPKYSYSGPIDHTLPIDRTKVKDKSVIVTGGANGMGETCLRAFVAAGAFVTFGDVNERGYEVEQELNAAHGNCCKFVKCNIQDWEEQKTMFETARQFSPAKSVDIVLANAGISRSSGDSMWVLDGELHQTRLIVFQTPLLTILSDPDGEAQKPSLNIVNTNLIGSLYTFKLAVHYFRKQPDHESRDRCFIITGSMNGGWIDSPVSFETRRELLTRLTRSTRVIGNTPQQSTLFMDLRKSFVDPVLSKVFA